MNLYILLFAIIVAGNEATMKIPTPLEGVPKTAVQLAKLIHLVSGYDVKETGLDDQDVSGFNEAENSNLQPFDLVRNKSPQAMMPIMALLQNNYDAHKTHQSPGARLHIIKNPRVLQEYQRNRKHARLYTTSDENSGSVSLKDLLDLRRNAVFRLETSSVEKALRSKANDNTIAINIPKKTQNIKFDDDIKRNDDVIDEENHNDDVFIDDDKHDIRKKGKEDDSLKQDNAWDIITKKYDWNESRPKYKHESPKNRKEPQKNIKNDDWDKITKNDFDDMDRNDRTTKNWERKKSKKLKNFDNSYERPKVKKIKDSNWDVTPYKVASLKTTKRWKNEPKDDWNKGYAPKISSYNRPKKRDNFDNSGSGFFGRTPIPYVGRHGIYAD